MDLDGPLPEDQPVTDQMATIIDKDLKKLNTVAKSYELSSHDSLNFKCT